MVWQLPIFNSEAVEEDGGLFNSIVTAFGHRMTRQPFGLQSASVEPSGTDLARIVIRHCQFDVDLRVFPFSHPTLGTGKR